MPNFIKDEIVEVLNNISFETKINNQERGKLGDEIKSSLDNTYDYAVKDAPGSGGGTQDVYTVEGVYDFDVDGGLVGSFNILDVPANAVVTDIYAYTITDVVTMGSINISLNFPSDIRSMWIPAPAGEVSQIIDHFVSGGHFAPLATTLQMDLEIDPITQGKITFVAKYIILSTFS